MIGISIGIGSHHALYAKQASRWLEHYTRLNSVILDDSHMQKVMKELNLSKPSSKMDLIGLLKLSLFEFFPEEENILYFDSDWCCVNYWDPQQYANSRDFIAVRDRVYCLELPGNPPASDPLCYFNAGFFICNRTHHKRLFDFARNAYFMIERAWHEQCVLNHVVHKLGVPIRFLDPRHNWMNYGSAALKCDVKAVHCSGNYSNYAEGRHPYTDPICQWNPVLMQERAGLYKLHFKDQILLVQLFYDGFTNANLLWFIDHEGQMRFMDPSGEEFLYVEHCTRVG